MIFNFSSTHIPVRYNSSNATKTIMKMCKFIQHCIYWCVYYLFKTFIQILSKPEKIIVTNISRASSANLVGNIEEFVNLWNKTSKHSRNFYFFGIKHYKFSYRFFSFVHIHIKNKSAYLDDIVKNGIIWPCLPITKLIQIKDFVAKLN